MARCRSKTRTGEPCRMAALQGQKRCFAHHPAKSQERAEARKRGGQNRRRPKSGLPQSLELRDVAEVRSLLETAARDTLVLENSVARNRTLAYLAGVVLKALKVGEFEERLDALEKILHGDGAVHS